MNKVFIFILATIFLSPCSITATKLHDACRRGNLKEAKRLINSGAEVGPTENDGWTPLHWATYKGHKETVKLLIDSGADLNVKDKDGETPLHGAVYNGREGVIELLLDRGADVGAKRDDGWTPLHYAAIQGHEKVVKQLTAAPLLLKQSNSVNSPLSKEALNKLDDYCVGYGREVFNLQLIPNKDFKFCQNLPEPAMESIVDNVFPIKNHIESRYLKAFLRSCHQDLKNNPLQGSSAFANLFIRGFYKNHLSELKLYIAIENNRNKAAIDVARCTNYTILKYLEKIKKAQNYNDLDKGLREQTEINYQLIDEPVQLSAGCNIL